MQYRYFPLHFFCQVLVRNKIVRELYKTRLVRVITGICGVISMRETSKFSAITYVVIHDNFSQCILPVSSELLDWILQWMDFWIMIVLETFHNLNHIAFTHPFHSLQTEVYNCGCNNLHLTMKFSGFCWGVNKKRIWLTSEAWILLHFKIRNVVRL